MIEASESEWKEAFESFLAECQRHNAYTYAPPPNVCDDCYNALTERLPESQRLFFTLVEVHIKNNLDLESFLFVAPTAQRFTSDHEYMYFSYNLASTSEAFKRGVLRWNIKSHILDLPITYMPLHINNSHLYGVISKWRLKLGR